MNELDTPDPVGTLRAAKTVAVIGASTRIDRPSRHAVEVLSDAGYTVIPVNPNYDEVLSLKCFPSLSLVPDATRVDIVNVFRRPEAVPELLDEVADWALRTGQSPLVWTQLGVSSPEAREKAGALNIPYIEERCIMIELHKSNT